MPGNNISEILKFHLIIILLISSNNFTLILNARLKPEAKNPPNGPMTELKILNERECSKNGYIVNTVSVLP